MFHRVDDPYALESPLFFTWAALLPHYSGAVRGAIVAAQATTATYDDAQALMAARSDPTAVTAAPQQHTPPTAPVVDDMAAIAAASRQPGAPWIEYSGG